MKRPSRSSPTIMSDYRFRRWIAPMAVLGAALPGLALAQPSPGAGLQDHSFFVEEAYNQKPGVVQHTLTGRLSGLREDDGWRFGMVSFSQEWPINTERHQLSYTLPFRGDFQKVKAHWESRRQGVGDVTLSYRYAMFFEDPLLPAAAPRFSLILPTGDEERGLSTGKLGAQVGFPVSKEAGPVALHANAGMTIVPGVRVELPSGVRSRKYDLLRYDVRGSVVVIAHARVQPLIEALSLWEDRIEESDFVRRTRTTVVSPGLRWGFDTDGGRVVLGAAAPMSFREDGREYGGFLYLSFEHAFERR